MQEIKSIKSLAYLIDAVLTLESPRSISTALGQYYLVTQVVLI